MRRDDIRDQMIGKIVVAYMGSITDARFAYQNDAQYHAQFEFLRRMLEIFDLAMDQENIPAGIRYRVLERTMMAAPDPAEARQRMKILSQAKLNLSMDWPNS